MSDNTTGGEPSPVNEGGASVGDHDAGAEEGSANAEQTSDETLFHGTSSAALPGLLERGRLDPADEEGVTVRSGEQGDGEVVSATANFRLAEHYAREGTPDLADVAPGLFGEATDAEAGAGSHAVERVKDLVERQRAVSNATEATAGAGTADRSDAPGDRPPDAVEAGAEPSAEEWDQAVERVPDDFLAPGLDHPDADASDDLRRASATADDFPVVVEFPLDAADGYRVDEVVAEYGAIQETEETTVGPERFREEYYDDLPRLDRETHETIANEGFSGTEAEVTGVDLAEATLHVDAAEETIEELNAAHPEFEFGSLDDRARAHEEEIARSDQEPARVEFDSNYVGMSTIVDFELEPAPDLEGPARTAEPEAEPAAATDAERSGPESDRDTGFTERPDPFDGQAGEATGVDDSGRDAPATSEPPRELGVESGATDDADRSTAESSEETVATATSPDVDTGAGTDWNGETDAAEDVDDGVDAVAAGTGTGTNEAPASEPESEVPEDADRIVGGLAERVGDAESESESAPDLDAGDGGVGTEGSGESAGDAGGESFEM